MRSLNKNVKKTCSFYVSNWHLTVMLLPYIKNEVEKNEQIKTFLEENLEENINTLIKKLNFKNQINEKIKNINWKNNEKINIKNETTILVAGKEEYVEKINKKLDEYFKNTERKVKIINCYEASSINSAKEILEKHSKILNTAGEKNIKEVI